MANRSVGRRSVGRPRLFSSQDLAELVRDLSSICEVVPIPDVIRVATIRFRCSRQTAYRALHRACEEGILGHQVLEQSPPTVH
jgi:hypothetical protein